MKSLIRAGILGTAASMAWRNRDKVTQWYDQMRNRKSGDSASSSPVGGSSTPSTPDIGSPTGAPEGGIGAAESTPAPVAGAAPATDDPVEGARP